MKNNKMKKVVLSLSLAAVLGLGGTLAYLNNVTQTKTNTFTSDGTKIEGKVEEKEWEETGKQQAEKYQPGDVIAKDPTVKLEADSEGAYVGMLLDYKDSQGNKMNYTNFEKYASTSAISAGWVKIAENAEGSELWAYNTALTAGQATDPIFTNVTVNAGITTVEKIETTTKYKLTTEYDAAGKIISTKLEKDESAPVTGVTYYDENGNIIGEATGSTGVTKLPKFEIAATGYAVQSQNLDVLTARNELINLANAGKEVGANDYFVATIR